MAHYIDGDLVVDNSTLQAVATCGTKAMLRYGLNLNNKRQESLAAISGTCIHKAVEKYFLTGSRVEALETLREEYIPHVERHANPGDRLDFPNIERCFSIWLDRYPPHMLPFEVLPGGIEIPFAIRLHNGILYAGQIDALVRTAGGNALYVLDTKSTGRPDKHWESQFRLGSQMTGYMWAAQQLYPDADVVGIYINVIHTGKVPDSNVMCRMHGMKYVECGEYHLDHKIKKYYRSQKEIESWLADARTLAIEWKEMLEKHGYLECLDAVDQRGRWLYQACSLCDYQQFCQDGRKRKDALEFEYEPWIPAGLGAEEEGSE